jgi:hypothetical protein
MSWQALDLNWRMTALFILAVATVLAVMKLVTLVRSDSAQRVNWLFVFSPLVSGASLKRVTAVPGGNWPVFRLGLHFGLLLAGYWSYWTLVHRLKISGLLLSYLGAPILWLAGESFGLLWPVAAGLAQGRRLPPGHDYPLRSRSVADFWGHRWNVWFSDWFRETVFKPLKRRPVVGLILVFFISGAIHEFVINLPLYLLTRRNLFGSMMLYFLLQAGGLLTERAFLKQRPALRQLFLWLVVVTPAPLILNEGLLRALQLWPEP